MSAPIITIKINTGRIDKSLLFKGEKGTYLDVAVFENDKPDQYGNDGFVTQSVSKEQREAGVKGPIIGNWKRIQPRPAAPPPTAAPPPPAAPADADDNLPF